MSDAMLFFRTFLSNPGAIGSVLPSSKHLVSDLLDGIDFANAKTIVEYGPGTGVFTDEIMRRLAPDAKLLCIELMDEFYDALANRYDDPRLFIVHGSATDVEVFLAEHQLGQADAVVSGLPFTSLPDSLRHEILSKTAQVLKPEGRFVLYQYSHFISGRIKQYFSEIQSRFTLFNFPPAFSFYCDRPVVDCNKPVSVDA